MKKIIATPQMTGACSEATMTGLKFTGEAARQLERLYLTRDVVAQRSETIKQLALSPSERVLDVGCGPGFLCESIADIVGRDGTVIGIDISSDFVALCKMNDSGVFAMDSLFNAICVLVTAAFVLTFVPGLTLGKRSRDICAKQKLSRLRTGRESWRESEALTKARLERVSQGAGYPYPRNFSSPDLCAKGFSLSFS
jgi:SAM-dependent methyltransferase